MGLREWFKRLVSGRPHIVIGSGESPYMLRWYLIPRNRWLNLYLHKFLSDDEDRALHDHPWWFVSLMIRGSYYETSEAAPSVFVSNIREAPSLAFRSATHRHKVALLRDLNGQPIPCWTVVLTGRNRREWGFWCPAGFVHWRKFLSQNGCE